MPKKLARKGAFWDLYEINFFPENQVQMQHSKILMFPENQPRQLLHFWPSSALIVLSSLALCHDTDVVDIYSVTILKVPNISATRLQDIPDKNFQEEG